MQEIKMNNISNAIKKIYSDARRHRVFWHYPLPQSLSGQRFSGLNLLLLGTRDETLLDPRWEAQNTFKTEKIHLSLATPMQSILKWEKGNTQLNTVVSVPYFNLGGCNVYRQPAGKIEHSARSLLNLMKLPYINSDHEQFCTPEGRLYLDPSKKAESCLEVISEALMSLPKCDHIPLESRGRVLTIARDLMKAIIVHDHKLDPVLAWQETPFDIAKAIISLIDDHQSKAFLSAFILVEQALELATKHEIPEAELLLNIMHKETVYTLLKTLPENTLKHFRQRVSACLLHNLGDIAWFHFICDGRRDMYEFYLTEINQERRTVKGWMVENQMEKAYVEMMPYELGKILELDLLFQPTRLQV